MQSPFPGMDPYLEPHWRDIHASLIIYARDAMQSALPGRFYARVEQRVFIESEEGPGRSMYPDVHVVEQPAPELDVGGGVAVAAAVATEVEPITVRLATEPTTTKFIEILDAGSGHRVVTAIEILSLTNKQPGPPQELYLKKQEEMKWGGVNLVEIDLLRGGQRENIMPLTAMRLDMLTTYHVCVYRSWQPAAVEVYPIPLQQRLPRIRIPLRREDADIRLDLQALIEQAYRNGRYGATLDYRRPPAPPLTAADAAWAEALLQKAIRV